MNRIPAAAGVLQAGSNVRLVLPVEDVPDGAHGEIVGFYRWPESEICLVRIEGRADLILVPSDQLEPRLG